jgi:hypothetical protein
VKVSGQEDRIGAAGPPGTVRLFNMDDGAPAGDPESTPIFQHLIQQPGGGIYIGGEAVLPPSPPQPPQTALAVARFNNVPPLQTSGFFVHDPFAGDHLQFRGLVVGSNTQSVGWTGLGNPGQETANLTESPASGASTPITTTPLVAANMPIIGEAGSGSQQPPPTGQQPPPGGSSGQGLLPLGEADLQVTARLLRQGLDRVSLARGGPAVALPVEFTVTNFGPDPAVSVRAAPVGSRPVFLQLLGDDTCPGPGDLMLLDLTAALCERLTVNDSFQVGAMYVVPGPGTYLATIAADALGPPDPGPRPNEGSVEIEVEQLPDSKGLKVTTPSRLVLARARGPRITGKATGARTVYVAIARREQGARVQTSAARCAWLANTRGTVRREPGRLCNEPIWLKARGTKSWRLNLSRQLPPGQYTVLSRAVEKSGVTEAAFSRRDGNRLDVRIRRR